MLNAPGRMNQNLKSRDSQWQTANRTGTAHGQVDILLGHPKRKSYGTRRTSKTTVQNPLAHCNFLRHYKYARGSLGSQHKHWGSAVSANQFPGNACFPRAAGRFGERKMKCVTPPPRSTAPLLWPLIGAARKAAKIWKRSEARQPTAKERVWEWGRRVGLDGRGREGTV